MALIEPSDSLRIDAAYALQERISSDIHGPNSRLWLYAVALTCGALFWLLSWYGDTTQSIVAIWQRSDTFAHGFLILPISAWLIWLRRHDIQRITPRPRLMALPVLALAGFGWLLGYLAEAGVVQQYALVLMILLLVWVVLGDAVLRALAFPLLFLLFAVPFGEFLVPVLMEHTADFTVLALRLTGIPVYREGLYFTIPSASWSVVEACSGLRYLIASLTLGVLFAYLTYRSLTRRVVFIALSVIVPIVANWMRAYLIVMIGHLSGMKYAAGVDHLIYGWIFFGFVMLILFWIGSFWREDHIAVSRTSATHGRAKQRDDTLSKTMLATISAAMVIVVWPSLASRIDNSNIKPAPEMQAPTVAGEWHPVAAPLADWKPRFSNPSAEIKQVYENGSARAGLYMAFYRNQRPGAKLITTTNSLVAPAGLTWRQITDEPRAVVIDSGVFHTLEARLHGQAGRLLVWRWYWIDGHYTTSAYWGKLLQARSQLLGRGDDGAIVIAYTPIGDEAGEAAAILKNFLNAVLPDLTRRLSDAR